MRTDIKGCSTCQPGKEQYEHFHGGNHIQYDYRTPEGVLFSCVAKNIEEAREKKDQWLNNFQHTKKTIDEIREKIKTTTCRWCGEEHIDRQPISYYPHDGGWEVEGFNEKQWLYIVCPKCEYQHALWKLGVPR